MRLPLDQNLSPRLAETLVSLYPDSVHVRSIGLAAASDDAIWSYARKHGFTIVTKDGDFLQRSLVHGTPPRVVWIRRGNCSTDDIERLLRSEHTAVVEFHNDDEAAFLTLG